MAVYHHHYLIFWNIGTYSSEMVKNSIHQRWRKHWDLLFWIDLKSMWKLPKFIHSCSFEVSLSIFSNPSFQFLWEFVKTGKYSPGKYSKMPIIYLPSKLGKIWKYSLLANNLKPQFLMSFLDWEKLESPAFRSIQISQF